MLFKFTRYHVAGSDVSVAWAANLHQATEDWMRVCFATYMCVLLRSIRVTGAGGALHARPAARPTARVHAFEFVVPFANVARSV